MTLDGKIYTRSRTPSHFTSKKDKRRLSEIRALGDAILLGRNTVATDSMSMGISAPDLQEKRLLLGKSPVPLRVILSERGRFDPKWKVFTNADSPVILCSGTEIPDRVARQFPPFVQILELPGKKFPLSTLLELLHSLWGVKTLVCEGGPTLFKSLIEADAVDELYLTLAPLIFGGREASTLSGLSEKFLTKERRFRLNSLETHEGEAFLHYLCERKKS